MPVTLAELQKRITSLENQQVDRHLKALIYGHSGTGKTTLSAWIAQTLTSDKGKTLYVDSNEGWVSLDNAPSLKDGVLHFSFETYADLPALAAAIKGKKKGFENVEVVVLDEGDHLFDDTLIQIVREAHGLTRDAQLPEIMGKDYSGPSQLMQLAISEFSKAGVHLIVTAHEREDKDHRGVTVTRPGLPPKFRRWLMGEMHVVAYASAQIKGTAAEPVYVRQVQALPTSLVEAKTRAGSLTTKVKYEHSEFVELIAEWVRGDQMAEDMAAPVVDNGLAEDELPTDGVPVADTDDDSPAYADED